MASEIEKLLGHVAFEGQLDRFSLDRTLEFPSAFPAKVTLEKSL